MSSEDNLKKWTAPQKERLEMRSKRQNLAIEFWPFWMGCQVLELLMKDDPTNCQRRTVPQKEGTLRWQFLGDYSSSKCYCWNWVSHKPLLGLAPINPAASILFSYYIILYSFCLTDCRANKDLSYLVWTLVGKLTRSSTFAITALGILKVIQSIMSILYLARFGIPQRGWFLRSRILAECFRLLVLDSKPRWCAFHDDTRRHTFGHQIVDMLSRMLPRRPPTKPCHQSVAPANPFTTNFDSQEGEHINQFSRLLRSNKEKPWQISSSSNTAYGLSHF